MAFRRHDLIIRVPLLQLAVKEAKCKLADAVLEF